MKRNVNKSTRKIALIFSLMTILLWVGIENLYSQCPLPGPIPSITGDTKACPGDSKPYTNGAATNATTYTWTLPAGCTISGQNPFTTASLSVTIDFGITFAPPGTISVKGNNICGSGNDRTKHINPDNPDKPSAITGNTLACPGDVFTYSVTTVPGVTNTWSVPSSMSVVSGQGTNSADISFNSGFTTSGTISVTATNGCGTSPSRTKQISKDNAPPTPVSITGPDIACPNDTKTYTVPSLAGVTNYNWTVPAGATLTGQGTTSVDVTFPSNFVSGAVQCQYQNNCGSSAFQLVQVRAEPTIPGLISGFASGICNCTVTYSIVPIQGATSYNWVAPAGATVVSGQGTNTADISFGSTVSGVVSVNCSNACGTSNYRNLAVTSDIIIGQHPANTSVCQDANAIISVTVPGCGLSYQWRLNGVNLSDNADFLGTQTSALTIIAADSLNGGSYDVIVSSTCASSVTSNAAALTVNMKPPVPGPVSGPAYACPGDLGVVFSVPSGGFNTTGNFWTVSADATIASGQGTNQITVDFGPTNSSLYRITCWGTNACGLSHDSSKTSPRFSTSTPHIAIGPNKVCAGQTNVDYFGDSVAVGATSLNWSVTPGITINSGQGTLHLNVDFDLAFVSGQICLQASTPCMTTPFFCKNIILDVPATPSPITGQGFSACNTTYTYSINSAVGAVSYNWSVPAGASIVSGQGSTSVDVSFANFTSGNVCVSSVGNCVNSPDRCTLVKGNPDKPGTITPSTGVFCANQTGVTFTIAAVTGATNYLWTIPTGAAITAGAGTTSITVDLGTADGNVGVRAQNSCGNSGTRTFFVDITCRTAGENLTSFENTFNVYPNPANDIINVEFVVSSTQNVSIKVTDILGKNVIDESRVAVEGSNLMQFDLKAINSGLYFITIKSPDALQQMRIVKE